MSNIMYIGGYQKEHSPCLHCCEFSGSAMRILESYEISNASYLCLSPDKKYLYAVIETDTFEGAKGGGVAAFAVEADGKLCFINNAPTEGEHPCHLSVSADGGSLYVANYSGGSTAFYKLLKDGGIGARRVLTENSAFGAPSMAVENRQRSPHAHFIQPRSIGGMDTVLVCDLGLDMLLVLDKKGQKVAGLAMPKGFGARHIVFHRSLPIAYVVGELSAQVLAVRYSANAQGEVVLKAGAPVSVSPDAKVSCAAIRISPDAKHLLVSNRGGGADSISVLKLDDNGNITGLSNVYKTRGQCPRDFAFTPEGDGVVVAYQDSDFVELLKWNSRGVLVPAQVELAVAKPTCVLFK